ncbi:MAG TPA: DEAD/DEAH box helicase [Actinomycetes bacterium]|nr:DEAD/DEAH box helicase [Actinomycetes bacterium]
MNVLHGHWSAGQELCLWAEDSALPARAAGRRGGRSPKAPTSPHPFACPPGQVRETVALIAAGAPAGELAGKAEERELTLLLPSVASGPLASPELVRDLPPSGRGPVAAATGRVALLPWRVPALALDAGGALELLAQLAVGETTVPTAVPVGASLRFLAELAWMALDLVGRGRVLPALVGERGGVAARWQPVVTGEDAERLRALAGAMPPVCRAERTDGSLDGRRSADVVGGALDALADAAVRWALTNARARGEEAWPLVPRGRGRRAAVAVATETWLRGLAADDSLVEVDTAGAAWLRERLDAWRHAAVPPAGPLRTCFRLAEPAGQAPAGRWRLELLLQATDEPSLLVPAAEVWRAGAELTALARRVEQPQEQLLADLGRASRLCPELERVLQTARPTVLELDAAGAHRFLRQAAPMLAAAGFGMLLPSWWDRRRARLGMRLTARPAAQAQAAARSAGLGLETLVDYRWDLALGEEPLTAEELAELARLKVPLVRLRGQWVELDPERLARGLAFLERHGTGAMPASEALRVGLGLEDGPAPALPLATVEAGGWLGDLLSGKAERRLEPMGTPTGFHGRLRPYQERGLAWLSFLGSLGLGACLADDMGLGKTIQLLALLVAERSEAGAGRPGPTLLVCPMSVVGNWQREAERFAPDLAVHVHHGAERLAGEDLARAVAGADLVLTTYGLAARDQQALAAIEWGRVVLDEAQNIKNAAAKQALAVRALKAGQRVALSGTPVENRLAELWSIMEFLNPGLLGSAGAFRSRYAVPIERDGDEQAAAGLRRATQPFLLRRLKTDRSIIADLPSKVEMKVLCNLTAEQASLYQAVVDDMLARIEESEGIERKGLVLATMSKLKQVCNHPAQLLRDGSRLAGRSGKLARLEEVLEEVLAGGDKALCFTQFAELGELLRARLSGRFGREVLFLHGGTPKRRRDAMVARFQDEPEPALFVVSLKAGGTGLNLTAANHVIHFDRWWNPAVEDQATDRAFRIGQRKDVQVRKLVCIGTLEERIDALLEEKKALAELVVGSGEGWLTELSTERFRELVTLAPEAVSE